MRAFLKVETAGATSSGQIGEAGVHFSQPDSSGVQQNSWQVYSNEIRDLVLCDMDCGHGVRLVQNSSSFAAISDERRKGYWRPLEDAVDKIASLNHVGTYVQIDPETKEVMGQGQRLVGVSAQEVEKVLPEAVSRDENGYLTLRYQDLSVLGIRAVQDLSVQVKALQQQNKELHELVQQQSRALSKALTSLGLDSI